MSRRRAGSGAKSAGAPRSWPRRLAAALAGLVAAALCAVLLLQSWYFAHIVWLREHQPATTAFMTAQLERLRERDPQARLRQQWVDYERISVHLKRAVIAAEDANFTEHDGIDWDALEKAYERNLRHGKVVGGGSTITMQLAKNLFLSERRSYLRKLQEIAIAAMLERVLTKRRILELYLNVAEWGIGVFGAEAAAQHYFGAPAAQLTTAQAARLAAMLPRPRHYDRNRDAIALARRAAMVQRWMGSATPP
jgi:monofunctional glycosyltransferase